MDSEKCWKAVFHDHSPIEDLIFIFLFPIDGAQPFVYDSTTHSCKMSFTFTNEGVQCASNPNICFNTGYTVLECDTNTQQATNLCLRSYFMPCLLDTDCYGNLICDQVKFICLCDKTTYYLDLNPNELIETKCLAYSRYKENCTEYTQCFGDLVRKRKQFYFLMSKKWHIKLITRFVTQ